MLRNIETLIGIVQTPPLLLVNDFLLKTLYMIPKRERANSDLRFFRWCHSEGIFCYPYPKTIRKIFKNAYFDLKYQEKNVEIHRKIFFHMFVHS